jgi:hypothetical protein
MVLSQRRIHAVVTALKWYYFMLAFSMAFALLASILIGNLKLYLLNILLTLLVSAVIFLGLQTRKPWIVPLIIILSAMSIARFFLLHSPLTGVLTIARVIGLWISVFELFFFTRKNVKSYFKVRKIPIF